MNRDMQSPNLPIVVFVGGFSRPADGTVGGQLFACTSLLNSRLKEMVDWHLIDSSQRSLPPPPIWVRGWDALMRVFRASRALTQKKAKSGLVFTSFRTLSLLEKMTICAWGGLWRKRMVVAYRSEIRPLGKVDWLMRPFLKTSLALTSHVICQSQQAADAFAQLFPKHQHKTVVIPNWIDTSDYQNIARQRQMTLMENTASKRPPVFLFLGWLEKNKGVHDLLNATKSLVDSGLDFRVKIGGSGGQREPLEKMARDLNLMNHVEFLGWITGDEKKAAMATADVMVLPSYSEGMPNSILEGMAAALPVIATRVGGIPSLVVAGATGLLIGAGQAQELAAAMRRLIENPEERIQMGFAGAIKAERDHSVEQAWTKVAEVLLPSQHVSTS